MIKEIILQISIWIIVIPFLVGLMNYKGLNKDSKWIFFLVVIALFPQLLTAAFPAENSLLNISYNIYTPAEFFILFVIFKKYLKNQVPIVIMLMTSVLYAAACIYYFTWYDPAAVFYNKLVCINNICYMIWILLLIRQEFLQDHMLITAGNPFTWYLSGEIIYASCSIIAFALYYYIRKQTYTPLFDLWLIQSVPNIILYLFFTAGLMISKKQ